MAEVVTVIGRRSVPGPTSVLNTSWSSSLDTWPSAAALTFAVPSSMMIVLSSRSPMVSVTVTALAHRFTTDGTFTVRMSWSLSASDVVALTRARLLAILNSRFQVRDFFFQLVNLFRVGHSITPLSSRSSLIRALKAFNCAIDKISLNVWYVSGNGVSPAPP